MSRLQQAGLQRDPGGDELVGKGEPKDEKHPFPWAAPAAAATLVVLGIFAALVTGNWSYFIPFILLLALIVFFLGAHRLVGLSKTRRYGSRDAMVDAASSDERDAIPHIGFGEEEPLGATEEGSDEPPQQQKEETSRQAGG